MSKKSKTKKMDRKEFIKQSLSSSMLMLGGSSLLLTQIGCEDNDDVPADSVRTLHSLDTNLGDFDMWDEDDLALLTENAKNLEKTHLFGLQAVKYNNHTITDTEAVSSYASQNSLSITYDDMKSIHIAMDQHAARNIDGYSSLLAGGLVKSSGAVGTAACCCTCTPCCSCATNVVKPVPSSSV